MDKKRKQCIKCLEYKMADRQNYYTSYDKNHGDGLIPVCKLCLKKMVDINDIESVKETLKSINKPFLISHWETSLHKSPENPFGKYMTIIQMKDRQRLTWEDSDHFKPEVVEFEKKEININIINEEDKIFASEMSKRNKKDVLRMLGYDPFEEDDEKDKIFLYNRLIDFLDEATLEDNYKTLNVIQIVTNCLQISKIDAKINVRLLSEGATSNEIKSLVDTKAKIQSANNAIAKDNGISINHNNSKSKGAGTLTGIIKQLQEKEIHEAEINLFDIETGEGIKQVADISNRSILDQLMLDENDYTEMIKEQRVLIDKYENKANKLKEENRLLKLEIHQLKSAIGGDN